MGTTDPAAFAAPGPMTELAPDQVARVAGLGLDAVGLVAVASGLLVDPEDPTGEGLTPRWRAERDERRAEAILDRILALDAAPLDRVRPPAARVAGTCRHFAVLTVALLRAAGIPSRARCGFATCFVPDRAVDHWIVERWSASGRRWVRADPELVGLGLVPDPQDLAPGVFLSAGEAWAAVRSGAADPEVFGVAGTANWGAGEIRGNVLRDVAALAKVEVLPWDEWGPMADSYAGTAGPAFDAVVDELADACASDDVDRIAEAAQRYPVPSKLTR